MPDTTLARDPTSSASSALLGQADGYLVCLRAGAYKDVRYFDELDEALDVYDHGDAGWYAVAMFACRLSIPYRHLTYIDICAIRSETQS